MIRFNKNSITFKLVLVMLFSIIVQIVFLVASYWISGTEKEIEQYSYGNLSSKVEESKNAVENKMNQYYSNFGGYALEIIEIYSENISANKAPSSMEIDEFLLQSSDSLLRMLRETKTSASFIILDNDGTSEAYSAVYLKDDDPFFNSLSNEDISVFKGPTEIMKHLQVTSHSDWNYGITLNEKTIEILETPMGVIDKSENLEELGYWAVSPSFTEQDSVMVTYTLPLIDDRGNAIGVIGVEISQDYFYDNVPLEEIQNNSTLGYIIAIYDSITEEIVPILVDSMEQTTILENGQPIELEEVGKGGEAYQITNSKSDETVFASLQKINLYKESSPFSNEQWVLLGMVEEDILFVVSDFLKRQMTMLVSISFLINVLVVSILGIRFSKPIVFLAKEVRENDSKKVVSLSKTGYSEIDDLSTAIEGFSQNILEASMKTDKILNMVNLPLATFEWQKGKEYIHASVKLLQILEIEGDATADSIGRDKFFEYLDNIKKNVEEAENQIYKLSSNQEKWIKIVMIEQEDAILGIVMDVTKEVLEKRIMQYEVDHDSLTKLLNRPAFIARVSLLWEKGIEKVAAFIILDLDNLKYINNTYGHDMGDMYIKESARIISEALRGNCVIGRKSGDEFYLFFYNMPSKHEIMEQLQTIYKNFDVNIILLPDGDNFKIRMSGGIVWYGEETEKLYELIKFADFALFQGKNTTRGEILQFNKEEYYKESYMLNGREELNKVIDNELIEYNFQPIVSAKTGEIYGYESLMRPQSKILSTPIKLLQIAAAQSQLNKIEKITFYKSLLAYKTHSALFNNCKLFINSVPNETLREKDYLELEELYPEILKHIVIEILENEKLNADVLDAKRALADRWGGKLALDDYGSGYNGDISLITLAPQIVKIDKDMIQGIESDRSRQSIIRKLLVYAKEQDITVLAEGVETYQQMEYLIGMGVELLQGYYIDRPRPLPDFEPSKIKEEILKIRKKGRK